MSDVNILYDGLCGTLLGVEESGGELFVDEGVKLFPLLFPLHIQVVPFLTKHGHIQVS